MSALPQFDLFYLNGVKFQFSYLPYQLECDRSVLKKLTNL